MRTSSPCRTVCRTLVFAICLLQPAQRLFAADELEKQYQKTAHEILTKLRSQQIHTTGVLKFAVRIGDGPFPPTVGNLNMRLAEKLELALVLANPARETATATQVGIVRGASDVANTIKDASHLTEEGRRLLFSKSYPLAWKHQDRTEVIPDSLIVGVAQVHADLSRMDIEIMLVSKSDLKIQPLASLTVPTDLEDLIDSGESFTTRGLFDGGNVESKTENDSQDKNKEKVEGTTKVESKSTTEPANDEKLKEIAKEQALAVRKETLGKSEPQKSTTHPLADSSDAPIKFEIWYGNKLQPYEFRDGAAFVKEPAEGEQVILSVRRKSKERKRYGVLIRVNGENTLYRERTPDLKAGLWILEPDSTEFGIYGFQIDNGTRQEFRVLSDADSAKRTIDYGRDVGMISVVVFEEETKPQPIPSDDELDLAVQSQTVLPDKTAESRGQLGQSLFDQLLTQDKTRGLIVEGQKAEAAIDIVTFKRSPTPVMATSIRYYNAK
ncbi:MAG: hypothetical protein KDB01_10135 [Planctomycetaceae bacterium]|nr:hypothetical protein [Planctomycetaceae bacterium]